MSSHIKKSGKVFSTKKPRFSREKKTSLFFHFFPSFSLSNPHQKVQTPIIPNANIDGRILYLLKSRSNSDADRLSPEVRNKRTTKRLNNNQRPSSQKHAKFFPFSKKLSKKIQKKVKRICLIKRKSIPKKKYKKN